ncbi:TPA: hypothetical protein N0F65_008484 [Lagenidium giganteum]|uniref:Uncharacterized protein n=1 Tax=Lagenidium giganteum TaxID=4803 RepID=A0AAV2Z3I8_9STRA|nr:TPA: hypothetical protein N0F65_008484 [Lagenidium giganteum]
MKIAVAAVAACVAAASLPTVQGWWDNAHMLVGKVASELMAKEDVAIIESVLHKWDADFPNTGTIATAAIWPDLVKCNEYSTICRSKQVPSLAVMEKWHFVNLPVSTDGSDWKGKEAGVTLFKETLDGEAIDVLEKSMSTMNSTKSAWAANLVLRNFIHVFGDLHQPLHVVGAVSAKTPAGDMGGNFWKFPRSCPAKNLHALWDAAGGAYSQNNWDEETDFGTLLAPNATELVSLLPSLDDSVNYDQYKALPYGKFMDAMVKNNTLKAVVIDSHQNAQYNVYPTLDLTIGADKTVACSDATYFT